MAAFRLAAAAAYTTSAVTVSTSGSDRFVLVHACASSSAAINVYIDSGSSARMLENFVNVAANESRDFGPYFISSTQAVRTLTDVILGHYQVVDEYP